MQRTNSKTEKPSLEGLEKLLSKRESLQEKWQQQHTNLDPDRNRTAGMIYENTKELEQACADLVKAGYAADWVGRWVGGCE